MKKYQFKHVPPSEVSGKPVEVESGSAIIKKPVKGALYIFGEDTIHDNVTFNQTR